MYHLWLLSWRAQLISLSFLLQVSQVKGPTRILEQLSSHMGKTYYMKQGPK